ncbi:beta-1,3-galactosyl-O-glycosyl-glycoprotein beta-1,6-N-acetylglucosaminyltransferase-like [Mercenaria mercenaria]|uniref:beta-1,3-galactosyl-O-glycosyl-glycoprotein beta-1,6-N-acetylglucosaminyltransferase-like n=1 Tax=Mercenaria mercenaria TaxID=6596 RepID=UPI00234EC83D|nr:beta-1,3-galactosyl-O-glycosyl-glycoprotein beta-1,6-N-acetylglucosaminyltransferase-like [Mercenaria mercenaria]
MRREMDEINGYVFKEELDMPIAYSILVYTDYEMIELLLRTVYKRHNTYCIHIDAKSPEHFRNRVMKLANCFDNVMIATKLVSVYWGQFSILEAEMSCMKDLFNKTKSWKYFINLTGQEFPLRTNYEIAKILRALRGHNNIGCSKNFEHYRLRTSGPPPHGLEVYKASTHVILTRKFVEYLLTDEIAHRVLMWSRKLLIPDEMVFPILNCNRKLKAPGSYKEHPSLYDHNKSFVSRYKIWRHEGTQCHGKIMRDICTFGPRDVENLLTRHELFANKFHFSEFPEVSFCLRNILLKRTILEYKGYMDFNVSFYSNIPYKW